MSYIKNRLKLYDGTNVASVQLRYKTYNSTASGLALTTATTGMINVSGYEEMTLAYRAATKNATLELSFQGRFEQNDTWGVIATRSILATGLTYTFYEVPYQVKYMRVGAKKWNTKGKKPNNLYVDLLVCEQD